MVCGLKDHNNDRHRKRASLEKNLQDTWNNSGVHDVDTREQCWLSLRLLERIRLHLTSIVDTGDMARKIEEYQI